MGSTYGVNLHRPTAVVIVVDNDDERCRNAMRHAEAVARRTKDDIPERRGMYDTMCATRDTDEYGVAAYARDGE